MAKELPTKFSVDLGEVVNNSIDSTRLIRKREQARKEAEFQRAIANGLSYEEQLVMREAQLDEEKKSSIADSEYMNTLEKSITDTKKLNRFNKYRARYAESLGSLSAGKINEEQYLSILKNQLSGIDDPELRLEIQGDIATAEGKLKTYNDTILSNQVKKAKYDGTKDALNEVIARVNVARAEAVINQNEDEVTAYDETLSALNSQLSSVRIQDSITDFQVKSSTRGINPIEKLSYINSEIQKADPNTAIKIGDRTYTSAQQFWSLERDNFLAGNSQIFGNFFQELNTHVKDTVDTATAKFGYPTQNILDDALQTFNDLRVKPEMTPFINRLDITQATAMSDGVEKYSQQLITATQGTSEFSFKQADAELQKIGARYGVDVTVNRVKLQNLSLSDQNIPEGAVPELDLKLPGVEGKPAAPAVPGATPITPTPVTPVTPSVGGIREVRAGDTLAGIAQEAGVGLTQLLELNPEFKENPNLIKPGQQIKLPGAISTPPTIAPIPTPTPAPTPTTPSVSAPITPKVGDVIPGTDLKYEAADIANLQSGAIPAPEVPKPVATPPTPASNYTGSSVVDYLKSIGEDSSIAARAKLALEKGIVKTEDEYLKAAQVGANAQFNERLLKTLRG